MFEKFHSLRAKINLIFGIILLLLVVVFLGSLRFEKLRFETNNEMHERLVTHYLYNYYLIYGKIDEAYLESQNFSLIKDKTKTVQIERYFKQKGKHKRYAVDTYRLQRIILINNDRFKLFLENRNKPKFPLKQIVLFVIFFILIAILYWWVMKSLQPIRQLKKQIESFSKGNLEIECKSDKSDEIAEVANEFHRSAEMIRGLLQSRQLFLRAIMHELKTPIAKGRLIAEMIKDETQKQRLQAIFERLGLLIDEFAKIEKIASKNLKLETKPYKMSDLVEASIDILLLDKPQDEIVIELKKDYLVKVDFELFTLVLKNLIDNALKYSSTEPIKVIIEDGRLKIINRGKPLTHSLEEYFKPFHASESGLGLGLYIVKSILDLHKMHLDYMHKDGENIFIVD